MTLPDLALAFTALAASLALAFLAGLVGVLQSLPA